MRILARPVERVPADDREFEQRKGDLVVFLYKLFDATLLEKACGRMRSAVTRELAA